MFYEMKIIKLIVIFAFFCSIAFAQEPVEHKLIIGLHTAPAGVTMYGAAEQRKLYDIKLMPTFGFIAGFEMQYLIKQKFALHMELNYERKGYADENAFVAGQGSFVAQKATVRLHHDYITVPIIAKFIISNGKPNFFVNTGIYAGYFINAQWNALPTENFNGDKGHQSPDGKYNNLFDCGLVTGLGCDIPVKERSNFSIELRNNLGFLSPDKGDMQMKHESLALLIGLGYKLK